LAYVYNPQNKTQKPVWAAIEIASDRYDLHRWEICLISYPTQQGWKPKANQIELYDVQLSENPPIISRFFAFESTQTNNLQAVLYWYDSATFNVNSTLQEKNLKISLVAYPESVEALPQIQAQLTELATLIIDYWSPIKIASPIAIILSQNGGQIAIFTSSILLVMIPLYHIEIKRQKKIREVVYTKLSDENKFLIDVIKQTVENKNIATVDKIAEEFSQVAGKSINEEYLIQSLFELEKTGAIKSYIVPKQDEPFQAWTV